MERRKLTGYSCMKKRFWWIVLYVEIETYSTDMLGDNILVKELVRATTSDLLDLVRMDYNYRR